MYVFIIARYVLNWLNHRRIVHTAVEKKSNTSTNEKYLIGELLGEWLRENQEKKKLCWNIYEKKETRQKIQQTGENVFVLELRSRWFYFLPFAHIHRLMLDHNSHEWGRIVWRCCNGSAWRERETLKISFNVMFASRTFSYWYCVCE